MHVYKNLLVQVTFDGGVGNQVPALVPLLSQVICRAVLLVGV